MSHTFQSVFFFVFWQQVMMRYSQLIGLLLVVLGSFLPLVHLPIIGNWNYWQIDHYLAIICWVFCFFALLGIIFGKNLWVQISGLMLIILYIFTIMAIKYQSLEYFSFLPFKYWKETFAGIVHLSWGWFILFTGALTLLLKKKN